MGILIKDIKKFGASGVGDMDNPVIAGVYSFIAETDDDVAGLPTQFNNSSVAPGSYCFCGEDKKEYYLAANGLWTEYGNAPSTVELDSIDIIKEPEVKKYYNGDALDTAGFAAAALYTNKSKKDLSAADVTFSLNAGTAGSLTPSSTTVTATYTEDGVSKTDAYSISCVKKLTGIAASGMTTSYTVGDALSIAGLVITASWGGADSSVVSSADYTLDYGQLSAGQVLAAADSGKKITVSYMQEEEGLDSITKTVDITITVNAAGGGQS
ncbi:MAG: hypothetical protein K6B40_05285 [Firmicutes bacterium]|nr:hypothetical protein [Bacillota bacterium]